MGFPVCHAELLFPNLFINSLSILFIIRELLLAVFRRLGLSDFLEPDISPPPQSYDHHLHGGPTHSSPFDAASAALLLELLPVVKFSDFVDPLEICAVCLHEFEADDDIRRLANCRHVFHQSCIDRWRGYDRETCPLCRTAFTPARLVGVFNETIWPVPSDYRARNI